MRVLWLSPFLPGLRSGAAIRIYYLLRSAARRHPVHLVCLLNERRTHPGGKAEAVPVEVREMCRSVDEIRITRPVRWTQLQAMLLGRPYYRVAFRSRRLDARIRNARDGFDVVVVEMTLMAWTALPPRAARVLDLHNIEHEVIQRTAETDSNRLRAWYRRRDAEALRRAEMAACRRFDLVAAPSAREVTILRSWGLPGRLLELPNGVDCQRYAQRVEAGEDAVEDYPEMVFIGALNYFPNHQAMHYFHRTIWPTIVAKRPQTTFGVIGAGGHRSVQDLAGSAFRVVGAVPDVRPYLARAKVVAVPLLSGGGTRLKILEAAAAGVPVVTTSLGCEGIDFRDGVHCRIADSPAKFAEACVDLLNEPERGASLAEAARRYVAARHDWQAIGSAFVAELEKVAQVAGGGET